PGSHPGPGAHVPRPRRHARLARLLHRRLDAAGGAGPAEPRWRGLARAVARRRAGAGRRRARPLVLGGLGRAVAWQRVLIAVAVAAAVMFFVQGSSTNTFAKFETIRTWRDGFPVIATGFGLVLLPGAAAALAAP